MAVSLSGDVERCDVVVVGAGLAGLVAAIGFARAGFSVVCCGAADRLGQGRTVALLDRSIAFLKSLDVWREVQSLAAPLRALRIIDDTGSLFPSRPIEFSAEEIGLDAFGWNIENAALAAVLAEAAAATSGLRRLEERVAAFDFAPERAALRLADGRTFHARLVVGADGRGSSARNAAGVEARTHFYPQSALTVIVAHSRPHQDCSTEFHTRQGPFTLVPLPAAPGAPARSSLVWVMSHAEAARRATLADDALAGEIEEQARSLLGAMRIEGERGVFALARQSATRLAATRLALVGDAAHVLPPIGAQGLNLGLRDVEGLLEAAREAAAKREDIGGEAALQRYRRRRGPDVAARAFAVDALNRSLIAPFAPIDAARGVGLAALGAIGPLRRFVMREGIAPTLGPLSDASLTAKRNRPAPRSAAPRSAPSGRLRY
ncbi:MAG: UbiH/UbiF family hydroxylase [Roseiarcus sp.]|jgi:2-octaprenyl-6-methoxyphenol hydroxylase